MIKKNKRLNAKGQTRTQVLVVEAYRPGQGANPKQRTIKNFGYLEDQDNQDVFMEMVMEFDANFKNESDKLISKVSMYSEENRKFNYGYRYLESIYDALDIDSFIKDFNMSGKFKGTYSPSEIFKFLIILRILSPNSKRATFQLKNN